MDGVPDTFHYSRWVKANWQFIREFANQNHILKLTKRGTTVPSCPSLGKRAHYLSTPLCQSFHMSNIGFPDGPSHTLG
jgi:hypothetical protein